MKITFDTEALLAFYLGEKGGEQTRRYLEKVLSGEVEGMLNILNLSELYYILYRKDPRMAEGKAVELRSWGVRIVGVPYDTLWREAAKIKATHAISLADAFAAATAKLENATLLSGRDEEFTDLGVEVMRIR